MIDLTVLWLGPLANGLTPKVWTLHHVHQTPDEQVHICLAREDEKEIMGVGMSEFLLLFRPFTPERVGGKTQEDA